MAKLFNTLSIAGGVIGGALSYVLGGWDALAKVLLIFICLDYVTGLLSAAYNGKLSSSKGFKGIIKKAFILLTVCLSAMMQEFLLVPVRDIVITFFVVNEGLSIVENLGRVITLPDVIQRTLEALRGSDNG